MPAIMTHDFFGKDALPAAARFVSLEDGRERDAFLLGNQGPDPLFYLVADPRSTGRERVGGLMHAARPARLICSLRDALTMLTEDELSVGRAYAAGFLCHYLLDRGVHPLVYTYQFAICDAGVEGLDRDDGSEVHAEIERDYDEMVLFAKTGLTVSSYRPYQKILHASDETLAVIDKLYFYMALWTYSRTLGPDCYTRAVHAFRAVQHLFYSPAQVKTHVLAPLERGLGHKRYSLYAAMAHRDRAGDVSDFDNRGHLPWINPFTGAVSHEGFWNLYEDAQAKVEPFLETFFQPRFDEPAARVLTSDLNFSGQPVNPSDAEGPAEPDPDTLKSYIGA